jgi:biopolymer transport protein ExbD
VTDEDVPYHGDREICQAKNNSFRKRYQEYSKNQLVSKITCLAESESDDVPLTGAERVTFSRVIGVVKDVEENDYEQVNA